MWLNIILMINTETHAHICSHTKDMIKCYSIQSLDWEDPLEEGMETHFSILAWRIPTDRGAWWAIIHGVAKSQT